MNKKGLIVETSILIGLGLLIGLILTSSLLIFVLSMNIFRLIGSALVILYAVSFLMGRPIRGRAGMILLSAGIGLIFLPFLADLAGFELNQTLAIALGV